MYGDRDYACNWYSGELVSLSLNYSDTENFQKAGYAPIEVNSSYIGGQVRQFGNLSFTRVYEAGHEVPAYQPETAYRIFQRIMDNVDVATGKSSTVGDDYGTEGPVEIFNITNEPAPHPAPTCYVLDRAQCTGEQWETVENGTALVRNWIVVDANTSHMFPDLPQPSPIPSVTMFPGAAAGQASFGRWNVFGFEIPVTGSVALCAILGSLVVML
jgi:hypothetical protein